MEPQSADTNNPPVNAEMPTIPNATGKMNFGIISTVIVVLLLIGGIGYTVLKHTKAQQTNAVQTNYANSSTIAPTTAIEVSPVVTSAVPPANGSGTKMNTSNANTQLDQDLQNIQGNLNQLNTDQGNANQATQNQGNDTPQP